jgi:hypothetical protein
VDFFSFTGVAGEQVYFDVDNSPRTLDTFLSLFSGNGTLLALADDSERDPGSASVRMPFWGCSPCRQRHVLSGRLRGGQLPPGRLVSSAGCYALASDPSRWSWWWRGGLRDERSDCWRGPVCRRRLWHRGLHRPVQQTASAIPEPSTLALMSLGMAGLAVSPLRRRNKARPSPDPNG